jgi:hypothetical protein
MVGGIRARTPFGIPNVTENLDLGPSQSPGAGRSQLARISNTSDVKIAPAAGAFASIRNQIFSHGIKKIADRLLGGKLG